MKKTFDLESLGTVARRRGCSIDAARRAARKVGARPAARFGWVGGYDLDAVRGIEHELDRVARAKSVRRRNRLAAQRAS